MRKRPPRRAHGRRLLLQFHGGAVGGSNHGDECPDAHVDGEAAFDVSGWSVALSADGTRLAVGAIFNDGVNGANSGHVRVFDYNGAAWTQIGEDIDGEDASDQSGASVALSADGTRLAVGAYVNGGVNGDFSGHARVYDVCSTNEPTPTPTRATTTPTR